MPYEMQLSKVCCALLSGDRKSAQPADSTRGSGASKPAASCRSPVVVSAASVAGATTTQKTGIPGIERALRLTGQPRRSARVEYICTCRRHGTFRHDRVPRMVEFFNQHSIAGCR